MNGQIEVARNNEKRLIEPALPACINQFLADIEVCRQAALAEANSATPRTTKLSPLQKQILTIASRWCGKDRSDVYTEDIKAEVFGWQALNHYSTYWVDAKGDPCSVSLLGISQIEQITEPKTLWVDEGNAAPGTARYAQDHHCAGESMWGQIFDRQSIGHKKYNTVSVSVSRAIKRLVQRHLLYQSGAGWSLTEHGLEAVKTMPTPTQS